MTYRSVKKLIVDICLYIIQSYQSIIMSHSKTHLYVNSPFKNPSDYGKLGSILKYKQDQYGTRYKFSSYSDSLRTQFNLNPPMTESVTTQDVVCVEGQGQILITNAVQPYVGAYRIENPTHGALISGHNCKIQRLNLSDEQLLEHLKLEPKISRRSTYIVVTGLIYASNSTYDDYGSTAWSYQTENPTQFHCSPEISIITNSDSNQWKQSTQHGPSVHCGPAPYKLQQDLIAYEFKRFRKHWITGRFYLI